MQPVSSVNKLPELHIHSLQLDLHLSQPSVLLLHSQLQLYHQYGTFHLKLMTPYVSITSHITQQNQSQIALARDAVENKRVELVPNMSAFIVQGNNQKTYSVQLFPKEKCNCPSTTTCWHIIASKLSLGIHNIIPGKKNVNLSQLKRNSRIKVDKKS